MIQFLGRRIIYSIVVLFLGRLSFHAKAHPLAMYQALERASRGREVVPQLVAYWFVGGYAVVATHWQRLARDAWNRVFHARADRWAYVLAQTDAADVEAAALARMQAVLNETLPAFQQPFQKN